MYLEAKEVSIFYVKSKAEYIECIRILEMDYFFSDINGQIFQSITSIFRKCLGSLKKIEVGVSKWKVKYKENCAST